MPGAEDRSLRGFRRLAAGAAGATILLILVGGVVRVSDSGLGCGPAGSGTEGWPLCGGRVVPFLDTHAIVEYSHRALAAVVTVLIAALALMALRRLRSHTWLVRGSLAAGGLVLFQAGLGGLTVEKNLHDVLVAAHLGIAMLLLGLLLALVRAAAPEAGDRPRARASRALRQLSIGTCVVALATIVSGGYMAGTQRYGTAEYQLGDGAHLACGKEFPSCNGSFMPFGDARLVDIHLAHRTFMYLTVVAVLALLVLARRRRVLTPGALIAGGALVAQVAVGAMNVWLGEHELLIVLHLALATLLWSALVWNLLSLVRVPAGRRAPAPRRSAPESSVATA
jgi:heme A synthase